MTRLRDIGGLLDRIAWASLPPEIVLKRGAAYVRERGPRGTLDYTTGTLNVTTVLSPAQIIDDLIDKLAIEPEKRVEFTLALKSELLSQYQTQAKRLRSSEADRTIMVRIQAAALAVFGPLQGWWRGSHPGDPNFYRLRIYQPGVTVALLRIGKPYREQKLVYRVSGCPTECVSLPVEAKNLNDAFIMLGLNKVSARGARLAIDWIGKAFVVNNYHSVPWDYR